jgi:hypothetical protein
MEKLFFTLAVSTFCIVNNSDAGGFHATLDIGNTAKGQQIKKSSTI